MSGSTTAMSSGQKFVKLLLQYIKAAVTHSCNSLLAKVSSSASSSSSSPATAAAAAATATLTPTQLECLFDLVAADLESIQLFETAVPAEISFVPLFTVQYHKLLSEQILFCAKDFADARETEPYVVFAMCHKWKQLHQTFSDHMKVSQYIGVLALFVCCLFWCAAV